MGDVIAFPVDKPDPHARMGPRGYALLNAPTVGPPIEHYWAGFDVWRTGAAGCVRSSRVPPGGA